ncbi:MAG: hypothetical protein A3J82_04135, partial [Elusimicrobia bacterium RIFOXYA2_FULL_69_6]
MILGVDLDNTIVCYDQLFRDLALGRGWIPATVNASKGAVRQWLRQAGQEDLWTQLQGLAYGPGMQDAPPFPGALAFFRRCRELGVPIVVISHRSRHPFLGPPYDLHQAAREWLAAQGFHDAGEIGLSEECVYFELTVQDKLARIRQTRCSHFIDDLAEFLCEPSFPEGVQKILFDPNDLGPECPGAWRADSWHTLQTRLL